MFKLISTPEGMFHYQGHESAGNYGDYIIYSFDGSETISELLAHFSLEEISKIFTFYNAHV